MSIDTVDDLHCAEDRIGRLESLATAVAEAWAGSEYGNRVMPNGTLADAIRELRIAVSAGYCRPSCSEDCDDDCGCPAHAEGESHHEEEA